MLYFKKVMTLHVIFQFGIVCKKGWKGTSSNTVFMLGVLFGSAGFGMIADKYVDIYIRLIY